MPVIKSAKKKLRVDKKRESANKKAESQINFVIKKAQKKPTQESVRVAFKAIDKGVKKDIFHKNKAARLKSRLAKLISKKSVTAKTQAPKTAAAKKTKKIKK